MYSPLYIKTEYSLLSSLIKIDNLIEKCKACNITSLAICDDNLFGTMEFIKKCYEYNYSEEEYVSESLGAYENTINHNLSLLNSKSKDLQYGFYCFIGSIILSILILVTYIV